MFDDADLSPQERLLLAVAFIDHPGVTVDAVEFDKAVSDGADPNGTDEDGNTPLTNAILGGEGSPTAVKKLLDLGADPSKRDKNGWTPWSSCVTQLSNPVVADNMNKIRETLLENEADQSDDVVLELQSVVEARNYDRAEELLKQGVDPNTPIISPLAFAIGNDDSSMMDLLLRYKTSPDGADSETHLMKAAGNGSFPMVKRLLDAGADVHKYAWDDEQWTAEFCAKQEGHGEIVRLLQAFVPGEELAERQENIDARNPKFAELYEKHTNGVNCGLNTEDVCKKLE